MHNNLYFSSLWVYALLKTFVSFLPTFTGKNMNENYITILPLVCSYHSNRNFYVNCTNFLLCLVSIILICRHEEKLKFIVMQLGFMLMLFFFIQETHGFCYGRLSICLFVRLYNTQTSLRHDTSKTVSLIRNRSYLVLWAACISYILIPKVIVIVESQNSRTFISRFLLLKQTSARDLRLVTNHPKAFVSR